LLWAFLRTHFNSALKPFILPKGLSGTNQLSVKGIFDAKEFWWYQETEALRFARMQKLRFQGQQILLEPVPI
jgi:hypothetical protein